MLEELRKGGTNAEIGVRLGVSPDAVKFHISNMLAKLGLDDRHQLAAWRPPRDRRRLLGTLALPGVVASIGRPLLWTGVALGGAAVVELGWHIRRAREAVLTTNILTTPQIRTCAISKTSPTKRMHGRACLGLQDAWPRIQASGGLRLRGA